MTPHLLIVNRSDSKCGNCGQPADLNEVHHDTVNRWGEISEGCHTRFVLVTSHYVGPGIKERIAQLRPDLTWVGDER